MTTFNPLDSKGNCSATSNNMKLVHWPLMGGLLHLVQRVGDWAGPQPGQAPPRCTKCNSPPINGQCTNHCIPYCYMMVRCCAVLMWWLMGWCHHKKVEVFPCLKWALGLELIPVFRQSSLQVPLLSYRPEVIFPVTEHHHPLDSTKLYCLVTDACLWWITCNSE